MSDEDEWKKLPTLSKVQHQQWKARLEGYNEAQKLFSTQTSETAPVFNEYVGIMKKFVNDPNAVALESALDAVLVYFENSTVSGKCAGDVCAGLIVKCLSSPRAKTRDKAIECLLQIVENEKHEVAGEELLKGLSNKNPKVVVGCLQTLRETLNLFGPKVVPMKALFKQLPRLFDDRDKNVRGEAKNITVEIHRWIGAASKTFFNELKPVVVTELNAILDELPPEKPTPVRYLRSQKPKEEPGSTADGGGGGSAATGVGIAAEAEEELDLVDPVNVLAQVPNDYWTLITEKKWQERQQALESLEKVTNVPLIAPGDFGDLIRSLLNVVNKDTNIVLATMATKILGQLASGLRKKYAPYAQQTIAACLQKFKERKPTVVAALRDTIDAAAKSVSVSSHKFESVYELLLLRVALLTHLHSWTTNHYRLFLPKEYVDD
ncbi:unnamed protein product [Echinostoma caproni]|uniref:Cytoskeleton-associated protein 5 n=1 Tax=Echinostoma caproni TaxID=27848 RepID=A0A183A1M1_9TREM|nr:unnamed protein product [Echinostoma caproni]